MYTRCPHCHTLYRIQTEQLEAAEGKARCCRCDQVFNALDNLQDDLTSAAETAPPAATAPAGQEPATPTGKHSIYQGIKPETTTSEQAEKVDSRLTEQDEEDDSFLLDAADEVTNEELFLSAASAETSEAAPAEESEATEEKEDTEEIQAPPIKSEETLREEAGDDEDTLILDTTEEPEDESPFPPEEPEEIAGATEETTPPGEGEPSPDRETPATEEEALSPQAATVTEQPLPFDMPEDMPEIEPSEAVDPFAAQQKATTGKGRGRLFWGTGALLLILLLGGQMTWYQRKTLMQHPQGKMLLEIACQIADCQLPRSRNPKLIKILNREIISHPTEEGALMLRLVLANQASFDQPYPLIELSLYNTEEKLVARRNFRPREYIAADRDSARLMPAGASEYVEMALEDPGSKVTGFQFDFF